MFGKRSELIVLVVVLVLVLDFAPVFEDEHEDEDENERRRAFSKHALRARGGGKNGRDNLSMPDR